VPAALMLVAGHAACPFLAMGSVRHRIAVSGGWVAMVVSDSG
jgi:hypothetical protein